MTIEHEDFRDGYIDLEIDYDIEPGEPAVYYPTHKAHPGSGATVEIHGVFFEGHEVSVLEGRYFTWEEIEDWCLDR